MNRQEIDQKIALTRKKKKWFAFIFLPILIVMIIIFILFFPVLKSLLNNNWPVFLLLVLPAVLSIAFILMTNYFRDLHLHELYQELLREGPEKEVRFSYGQKTKICQV